jgi:hypothetical protein
VKRAALLLIVVVSLAAGQGCCHSRCGDGPFARCARCQGCGEMYWGDWFEAPPPCCDPCDQCGNWVGPPESASWPYRSKSTVEEEYQEPALARQPVYHERTIRR